jgi:hypothetical protein
MRVLGGSMQRTPASLYQEDARSMYKHQVPSTSGFGLSKELTVDLHCASARVGFR